MVVAPDFTADFAKISFTHVGNISRKNDLSLETSLPFQTTIWKVIKRPLGLTPVFYILNVYIAETIQESYKLWDKTNKNYRIYRRFVNPRL